MNGTHKCCRHGRDSCRTARHAAYPDRARGLSRTPGIGALLSVQCLGTFNDNLLKTVVSLMAAEAALTGRGSSSLLPLSGIAFVAPYVLLAGYAGFVADRFDKRNVIVVAKAAELLVMALAILALMAGWIEALVAILFLVSIQATFVSPAKYGLLPEALATSALSRANGLMEVSRYGAVILGTASGGLALSVWRSHPDRIGALLLTIATLSLMASLFVRRSRRAGLARSFRLNPWSDIGVGMRRLSADPRLSFAVAGLTCFDFVCTLVMLDMILIGKTRMRIDDWHIGVLGTVVGLGAGIGSIAAGRLSRGRIEPTLAFAGYVGIGAALLGLAIAVNAYLATAAVFMLLGVFAGMVIVPLNAMLQATARAGEKGLVIATNNFLNMMGAALASGCLWLLHDIWNISPNVILVCGSALAFSFVLYGARRRPQLATRGLARWLISVRKHRARRPLAMDGCHSGNS